MILPAADGGMAGLLVRAGRLRFDDSQPAGSAEFALFERAGEGVAVTAEDDTLALYLGGEPIDEPVVARGPFVMNTEDDIRQAIHDNQGGQMGRLA